MGVPKYSISVIRAGKGIDAGVLPYLLDHAKLIPASVNRSENAVMDCPRATPDRIRLVGLPEWRAAVQGAMKRAAR
jgi:hypothetical protein